jgi:chromosome partitioning protein
MIHIIGGLARGTGKTTIAVNLAVDRAEKNKRVVIVDCEPDQSAFNWSKLRSHGDHKIGSILQGTPPIDVVCASGDITLILKGLNRVYDIVIVDVGARDIKAFASAMRVADNLYTPIYLSKVYSEMLLGELKKMILEIKNPRMRCFAFANRPVFIGEAWNKELVQTGEVVFQYNVFTLDWPLMEHEAIRQSIGSGLGVNEIYNDDSDWVVSDWLGAHDELEVLANHVFGDEPFMRPKYHNPPAEFVW